MNIYIYIYIYQRKYTPLHYAAERGKCKRVVEALVEANADLNAQDEVSALKETRADGDRGMRSSRVGQE